MARSSLLAKVSPWRIVLCSSHPYPPSLFPSFSRSLFSTSSHLVRPSLLERKGDGTVGSAPREDQRQKGEGSARCSHKQLVASAKLPRLSYGNAKLETRLLGYTTYPAEWLGWAQVCVECERLPRESENGARSGVLDRWLKQRQFPSLFLFVLSSPSTFPRVSDSSLVCEKKIKKEKRTQFQRL